MGKEYDVICIGQVTQDILVTNIPVNGFEESDTIKADTLEFCVGGDAANQSVILSRMGNRTAILSRIDNGEVGKFIYNDLKHENVDTALLKKVEDSKNYSVIVLIRPDGNHDFIVGSGYNFSLKSNDYDLEVFKKAKIVSAASLFTLGELDYSGIDEIFGIAQSSGALTVADTNYNVEDIDLCSISKVYPYIDYFMPSIGEAQMITGKKTPEDIADWFIGMGVKNVVLKLGDEGCFFKNNQLSFYVDAYDIEPKDTTGCGDNFIAGFIHCLLKEKEPEECCLFACACGALNSLEIGAHMCIKSEKQVLDFMKKGKRKRR